LNISTSVNKSKTILHLFSGDLWAGAEVMVYNLLSKLKDFPDLRIIALSLNEGILTQKLRDIGIEIYVIPENDNTFLNLLLKTHRLLKKINIDIIHSHRYKENLIAFLLAKSLGVKRLITTMHGLAEPLFEGEKEKIPLSTKTKMDHFLINRFFSDIIAVSQEMKTTLVNKYHFKPSKIKVIYNGIPVPSNPRPLESLTPCLKKNGFFHIGTVGRMVPVKGYDLFLEIASEIKKQNDKVRFSILGDGPLKDHLMDKAKELGIDDCVEFITPVPDPFPYYNSLDIYMNTSFHEGLPLSILEAMSCGKPIVAPRTGGIPEIFTNNINGILVDNRKAHSFTTACISMLANKVERKSIENNNIERIRDVFSNNKMAEYYHNIYKND
jgi:L-malate glycosyltransferase